MKNEGIAFKIEHQQTRPDFSNSFEDGSPLVIGRARFIVKLLKTGHNELKDLLQAIKTERQERLMISRSEAEAKLQKWDLKKVNLHLIIFIRGVWSRNPGNLTDAVSNGNFDIRIRVRQQFMCN